MALAIHAGHDSNIAMSIDGRVQCVLELERFFGERYYDLLGHLANKVSRYLFFCEIFCEYPDYPGTWISTLFETIRNVGIAHCQIKFM